MPTPAKDARVDLVDILLEGEGPRNKEILRRSKETRPPLGVELDASGDVTDCGETESKATDKWFTGSVGSLLLPQRLLLAELPLCTDEEGGEGRGMLPCCAARA